MQIDPKPNPTPTPNPKLFTVTLTLTLTLTLTRRGMQIDVPIEAGMRDGQALQLHLEYYGYTYYG